MKVKDIVLGKRYAIHILVTKGPRTARNLPVVHATCVDIAGNTVVFNREAMVLSAAGTAYKAKHPDALVGNAMYEPGRILERIPARHVICPSDEWAPSTAPDGRLDAPTVTRAAGHTFTAERMMATA